MALIFHERMSAFIGRAHRVDQLTATYRPKGKTQMRRGNPHDWKMPGVVPDDQEMTLYQRLFRGALCSLMGPGVVDPKVRGFLDEHVPVVDVVEFSNRMSGFARLTGWRRERDARMRRARAGAEEAVVTGQARPAPVLVEDVEDPYLSGPSEGATLGDEPTDEDDFHGLGEVAAAEGDWDSLFADTD